MATTYTACPGTGQTAINTRRVTGAEGRFFRLNGITFGTCPDCGRRSLNLGRIPGSTGPTPRHKAADNS